MHSIEVKVGYLGFRVRAGLVGGDERDADAEVDLFWAACVREQCARLVDTPDEVPREI